MKTEFQNISIEGIQVTLPTSRIDNMNFAKVLGERRCKKQIRLTGVQTRQVSQENQTSADLAYIAGNALIERLKWDRRDIKVLVFATQNPLFALPSTAFYLQKMLQLPKDCIVFDINLGCSAALIGSQIVSALLNDQNEESKGILLIADPVYPPKSNMIDPEVIAQQMLFGSAGSAIGIKRRSSNQTIPMLFNTYSDGNRYQSILRERDGNSCKMDGASVFSFGINDVTTDMKHFREDFNIKEEDIDYYSFHQAQKLMLDTIDAECGISSGKDLRSMEHYGNTNGSSVLLNLCANRDILLKQEKVRMVFCAFGVGLSWSFLYASVITKKIFPIIYSDTHYEV